MPGCVCVCWGGGGAICRSKYLARGGFPERRTCGAGEEAGNEILWRKGIWAEDRVGTLVPEARRPVRLGCRGGQRGEVGWGLAGCLRAEWQGDSGSTVERQSRGLL